MKKALILSAALFALGAGMPAQAAGPMSPTGISPIANSNGTVNLHNVARRRVCRRTCVTKGWGFKKRRVCRSVCRWR